MKHIELSQGKYAIIDNEDFEWLSQWKWYFIPQGYAFRSQSGKTIYMHRKILNTPKEKLTDHINRNKLDNRKVNLRIATRSQNAVNVKLFLTNTSGYRGVWWERRRNKWIAEIKYQGKKYYLGEYLNKLDAIKIRRQKTIELFGKFAIV